MAEIAWVESVSEPGMWTLLLDRQAIIEADSKMVIGDSNNIYESLLSAYSEEAYILPGPSETRRTTVFVTTLPSLGLGGLPGPTITLEPVLIGYPIIITQRTVEAWHKWCNRPSITLTRNNSYTAAIADTCMDVVKSKKLCVVDVRPPSWHNDLRQRTVRDAAYYLNGGLQNVIFEKVKKEQVKELPEEIYNPLAWMTYNPDRKRAIVESQMRASTRRDAASNARGSLIRVALNIFRGVGFSVQTYMALTGSDLTLLLKSKLAIDADYEELAVRNWTEVKTYNNWEKTFEHWAKPLTKEDQALLIKKLNTMERRNAKRNKLQI